MDHDSDNRPVGGDDNVALVSDTRPHADALHRRNGETGAACSDDTGVGGDAPEPAVDVSQLEFLTVEECAQYLRLDRKTIYSMIRRGELPGARRCGRTYRIHRASVVSSFSAKPRPVHHGGKR